MKSIFVLLAICLASASVSADVEVRTLVYDRTVESDWTCGAAEERLMKDLREQVKKLEGKMLSVEIGECDENHIESEYTMNGKVFELSKW